MKFLKNIFTMSSGALLGQIIAFAMLPYILRGFTQEEFGYFGSIVSIATIISYVISLRLDNYVIKLNRAKVIRIFFPILAIVFLGTFFLFLLLLLCVSSKDALVVSLYSFVLFYFNLLISFFAKSARYSSIAMLKFLRPVLTSLLQGIVVLMSLNVTLELAASFALLFTVLGFSIHLSVFVRKFRLVKYFNLAIRIVKVEIRTLISLTVQTILNSGFHNCLILYAFFTHDYKMAGVLSLLERITRNPISMLSFSLRSIAISDVDKNKNGFSLSHLIKCGVLGLIITASFIIIERVGVISFITGESWGFSYEIFLVYLITSVIVMCNSINGPQIIKQNKTKNVMYLDAINCGIVFGVAFLCYFNFLNFSFLLYSYLILTAVYFAYNSYLVRAR